MTAKYKYQIYCNPGKGIYRCFAERYGAPEAYIRELFDKYPDEKDWLTWFKELNHNFSEVRKYCDYCERRAIG